jgi:hypothetical protein
MTRAAILMILPLLAACHVQARNPDQGDDNVSINADGDGHLAFNLPFAKGEVKLPASVMHKGDFDIDGVKMMPGTTMTGFNLDAGGKTTTVKMNFTAPAPPDEVRAYFVEQFKEQGAEAQVIGDAVTGKSKDGSPFAIHVVPAAGGSSGTIEVESRD